MTIPSPISNMMQSDSSDNMDIYYQYKTKTYALANNGGHNLHNSLKRPHKVGIPAVPMSKPGSYQDQASQVPSHITNDFKHIPVYIEHNLVSKEMAV